MNDSIFQKEKLSGVQVFSQPTKAIYKIYSSSHTIYSKYFNQLKVLLEIMPLGFFLIMLSRSVILDNAKLQCKMKSGSC